MRVKMSNESGESPRSKIAADLAVQLRDEYFELIEPWLSEDFRWVTPGGDNSLTKQGLMKYMSGLAGSSRVVESIEIVTAISHGRYASVSLVSHDAGDKRYFVHDLYEFTDVGEAGKLRKLTSYVVEPNR